MGQGVVTRWPAVVEGAAVGPGPVGVLDEVAPQLLLPLPPLVPCGHRRGVRPCTRLRRHAANHERVALRPPGRTTAGERKLRRTAGEWRRVLCFDRLPLWLLLGFLIR